MRRTQPAPALYRGDDPLASLDAAAKVALLERIADSNYQYNKGNQANTIRFTFSCGLSEFSPGDTPEALIERADEALYQAKKNGKNQVRLKQKSLLRGFFGS